MPENLNFATGRSNNLLEVGENIQKTFPESNSNIYSPEQAIQREIRGLLVARKYAGLNAPTVLGHCDNSIIMTKIKGESLQTKLQRLKEQKGIEGYNRLSEEFFAKLKQFHTSKQINPKYETKIKDYYFEKYIRDCLAAIQNIPDQDLTDYNITKEQLLESVNILVEHQDKIKQIGVGRLHGDPRVANFMVNQDDKLSILDFEKYSQLGLIIEDIGQIIKHIQKQNMNYNDFEESYGMKMSPELIKAIAITRSILHIARKKQFVIDQKLPNYTDALETINFFLHNDISS